jgi:hypothetical protein
MQVERHLENYGIAKSANLGEYMMNHARAIQTTVGDPQNVAQSIAGLE